MAKLDLGRTMESRNGSLDPLLSSVKPIVEDFKVSGKVDDKAINVLFDAIKALQKNQADFQMRLASENNDAIVMKLKSIIEKLAELLPSDEQTNLATQIAEQLENKQEKEDVVKYLKDNTPEEQENEKVGDYEDVTVAENFNTLQTFIQDQFDQLKKNFAPKSFKTMLGGFLFAPFKKLGDKFNNIKAGISGSLKGLKEKFAGLGKGLLSKFKFKLPKFKLPSFKFPKIFDRSKSAKDKKAEKRQNSIFDSLEKLVKRLKKFANNAKEAVLSFLKDIVVPAAKIIAGAIGIILKPVMSFLMGFFWGSGIGILLIAVAFGIALIALAVKKIVDFVVDDLGPEIQRWMSVMTPEQVNNFMGAVSNFINTFSALMAGLFAPIIAIGTLIMAAIKPIGEFVGELLTSVKNHIMPIIDKIFGIVSGTILKILEAIQIILDPILDLVKAISLVISTTIQVAVLAIEGIVKGVLLVIQFVRDHIDEIIDSIKNNFWVPTIEWGDDSGSRTSIGKLFDRIAGSRFMKNYLFLGQKVPFGESPTVQKSVDIKQEADIKSIDNVNKSAANALEENKEAKKQLTLEDFKNDMTKFLTDFRDITQKNFEEISKKLDNPQVIPLPLPATLMNPALLENRW